VCVWCVCAQVPHSSIVREQEPMSAADVEQNNRIVTELSSTLKTIFKL